MPYTTSTALTKLHAAHAAGQPLKIAFLDVDGTLTGSPTDQGAVRTLLEQQDYTIVFVTHRSSELCMSRTPGTNAAEFQGLLDPDVIAGKLGNEIVIRQNDGSYKIDKPYTKPLSPSPEEWPVHKQQAADHIFKALYSQLSVAPAQCVVLLAGDNVPDLPMGLLSAAGSSATFLIPGGAPLAEVLFSPEFTARYPLQPLEKGVYRFSPTTRTVIVGDEAFPGTTGPTTLQVWLKTPPVL